MLLFYAPLIRPSEPAKIKKKEMKTWNIFENW